MDRDEFYALLAGKDEAALKRRSGRSTGKARGRCANASRGLLGVVPPEAPPIDPQFVLRDVKYFAALVRSGAYLGGDRRVSPRERTGGGSFSVTWSRRPVPPSPVMMRSRCGRAQLPWASWSTWRRK